MTVVTKWHEEHPVQYRSWTPRRERRERIRWNRSRRKMNQLQRYLVRNLPGLVVGAKRMMRWRLLKPRVP
jgi:hypothetical protein